MAQGIWQNQNVETGLWFGNHFFNDRMTYVASVYRQDLTQSVSGSGGGIAESYGQTGDNFNDGTYGVGGRLTFLPIDDEESRQLLHFGVSVPSGRRRIPFCPRRPVPSPAASRSDPAGLSLGATAEIRDSNASNAIADSKTSGLLGGIQPTLLNTGNIFCDSSTMFGLESLYIYGPLSFQAEYAWSILNDVTAVPGVSKGALTPTPTVKVNDGSYMFNGGYLQVSYFLTGESRSYSSPGRQTQHVLHGPEWTEQPVLPGRRPQQRLRRGNWSPAFPTSTSTTAAAPPKSGRYRRRSVSRCELVSDHNLRYMFQYQWNDRYQVNPATTLPGNVEAFAVRMQWMF